MIGIKLPYLSVQGNLTIRCSIPGIQPSLSRVGVLSELRAGSLAHNC